MMAEAKKANPKTKLGLIIFIGRLTNGKLYSSRKNPYPSHGR